MGDYLDAVNKALKSKHPEVRSAIRSLHKASGGEALSQKVKTKGMSPISRQQAWHIAERKVKKQAGAKAMSFTKSLTTAVKTNVGKTALKTAGRFASKAALPVAAAVGAYDIGRAGVEGYKAVKAAKETKTLSSRLKERMKKGYKPGAAPSKRLK